MRENKILNLVPKPPLHCSSSSKQKKSCDTNGKWHSNSLMGFSSVQKKSEETRSTPTPSTKASSLNWKILKVSSTLIPEKSKLNAWRPSKSFRSPCDIPKSQSSADLIVNDAQGTTSVCSFNNILDFWRYSSENKMMDIDKISPLDVSICFKTNTACFDVFVETANPSKRKWVDKKSTSPLDLTDYGSPIRKKQKIVGNIRTVLGCTTKLVNLKRARDSGMDTIDYEHDASMSKRFKQDFLDSPSYIIAMSQEKEEPLECPLNLIQRHLQATQLNYSVYVSEPVLNKGLYGLIFADDYCFLLMVMCFVDYYGRFGLIYDKSTIPLHLQFKKGSIEGHFPFDPGSKWNLIDRKKENMRKIYTFCSTNLEDFQKDSKHVTWLQWLIAWTFLFFLKDMIFLMDSDYVEDDWDMANEEIHTRSNTSLRVFGGDSPFESFELKTIKLYARDFEGPDQISKNSGKAGTHFAPQSNGYIICEGTNICVKSAYKSFSMIMTGVLLLSSTKNSLIRRFYFDNYKKFWIFRDTDHEFIAHLVCSCHQRLSIWLLFGFPKHHHDLLIHLYRTCAQVNSIDQLISHVSFMESYRVQQKVIILDDSFVAQESTSLKCCNKLSLFASYAMFYVYFVKTMSVRAILAIMAHLYL